LAFGGWAFDRHQGEAISSMLRVRARMALILEWPNEFTTMKSILIIEDQADIRRLIRWTLEDGGYDIHEASHGSGGLTLARAVRPDLVLLDVMMPGDIDGLQLCRMIKTDPQLKHAVVVLLTARGQVSDREAGKIAGADIYLVKPFKPQLLEEIVHRLLPA
jgi:two-component system phosphate regulon response regulator PhoB